MPRLRGIAVLLALVALLAALCPVPASGAERPANDDFADAIQIGGTTGSASGTLSGATREVGEPLVGDTASTVTVWWAWTAPADGIWRFQRDVDNGSFAVWQGTAVDQLTEATVSWCHAGQRSGPYIHAVAGQTYHLQFKGQYGPVGLSWEPAARPANDDFASATSISGFNGSRGTSTCLATSEAGEPLPYRASRHTVWFRWQAADRVRVTFQMTEDRSVVHLWRGSTLSSLAAVGKRWHTGAVELEPEKGAVYYVQVAQHSEIDRDHGAAATLVWRHDVAHNDDRYHPLYIPPPEADNWERSGAVWADNIDATRQDADPVLVSG
jgi:hypothetical protein